MNNRHVPLSILFRLGKKPFVFMGPLFTLISLFILIPLVVFLTSLGPIDGTGYNYDAIYKNGVEKKARVISIEEVNNVTVNNKHPQIVNYRYDDHGLVMQDEFETMDFARTDALQSGETITIKFYNGQSAIVGMEQFSFPDFIFYLMPLPFLIVGIIFCVVGFLPAVKKYKLLKDGRVVNAHLLSLTPSAGMPVSRGGKILNVYYYYTDRAGKKHFGEDATTDFSMMAFYKPEDVIKIAVDEMDESKSCLMPPKEIKRNGWAV